MKGNENRNCRWKIHGKRTISLLLSAVLAVGVAPMTSLAATRKKISTVNLKIESDIAPETDFGDENIDVTIKGEKYSYSHYEIENFGFEWAEDDVPEITIYLYADDGYYFSLTKASSVKLKGATYVKATKQDSSETLKLTVKLPSLAENIGEQTEVTLTETGQAYWEPVRGAGSYEVRLYRNDNGVGMTMLTTEQPSYDFTSMMIKPGSYHCKVRAVNKVNQDNKSDWEESAGINISSEQATAIRTGTAAQMAASVQGNWRTTDNRWWYEHRDGSYTMNNWELIENQWYFFDEEGYMKTGWIDWNGTWYYCDETSGAMLTNATTPDGYIWDYEGKLKNGD